MGSMSAAGADAAQALPPRAVLRRLRTHRRRVRASIPAPVLPAAARAPSCRHASICHRSSRSQPIATAVMPACTWPLSAIVVDEPISAHGPGPAADQGERRTLLRVCALRAVQWHGRCRARDGCAVGRDAAAAAGRLAAGVRAPHPRAAHRRRSATSACRAARCAWRWRRAASYTAASVFFISPAPTAARCSAPPT